MENGGSWSEGTTAGQSCARPPAGKGVALEEGPASWPGVLAQTRQGGKRLRAPSVGTLLERTVRARSGGERAWPSVGLAHTSRRGR